MLANFPRVEFLTTVKKTLSCISVKCVIKKFQVVVLQSNQEIYLGPVPKRPISVNPGLKFCAVFVFYLPVYCSRLAFCVIIIAHYGISESRLNTIL